MQTFLPYESFRKSAKVLDWRRLGKQRVEGMQIINAIENPKKQGWQNHPCTVMWRPYLPALKHYTNIIIMEWMDRGIHKTFHSINRIYFHSQTKCNMDCRDKKIKYKRVPN